MADSYLADPAFQTTHKGPRCKNGGRLPSRSQILRMAEAIRQARPRPMVGGNSRWSVPLFHRETLEPVDG